MIWQRSLYTSFSFPILWILLYFGHYQKCMCFSTGAKMIKHVGDMKYLAQFVPKSIETVIKRDIFHVWWHHASLILQTLLLRMLASLASKAQQAAEVGDCGLMHIHNVS